MLEDLYNKFWLSIDKMNQKRIAEKSYSTPPHISEKLGVKYGLDKEQYFDMFYPKSKANQKLPTIVHIHGGAYISGVKDLYTEYCQMLAQKGYCVINLEYIKGLRIGFPHPVFDFFKFYEFIEKNPEISSHIDFGNFLLSGDSSGGHVASLIANIQTNPSLKQKFELTGGPDVKGCILTCPMLGVYKFKGLWPKKRFEKLVYKDYYNTKYKDICHNLETITNKFPPSIIISASNDFIKLHAYLYEKTAKKIDLSLEHYCVTSGKHLSHCSIMTYPQDPESQIAHKKIQDFVEKVLNKKTKTGVISEKINKKTLKLEKQKSEEENLTL